MQMAELYIRERRGPDGKIQEDPWVLLRKNNGTVARRLKLKDYERFAAGEYRLKNRMLLHLFNHRPKENSISRAKPKSLMAKIKNRVKRLKRIKVTGIDMERTFKPDEKERYHHFYFSLSEEPSDRWVKIFTNIAESRKAAGPNGRYVWLEDGHIAIRCPMGELRVGYLADIREMMKDTNIRYETAFDSMMGQGKKAGIDRKSLEEIARHMFESRHAPGQAAD